jgi:argininosuccinate synthase
VLTRGAFSRPQPAERHTIGFEAASGLARRPKLDPVRLIEQVEALGAKFGVGRGIHLGDTIIGFKGASRSRRRGRRADHRAPRAREARAVGAAAARQGHARPPTATSCTKASILDPVCRDIEALLALVAAARDGRGARAVPAGVVFIEGTSRGIR